MINSSLKASPSAGGGTPEPPGTGLPSPWPHPGLCGALSSGVDSKRMVPSGDVGGGRGRGRGCGPIPEVAVHVHVLICQAVKSRFMSPLHCVCLSQ